MPKITTHGGPSHWLGEPQPRPGEGEFFQPAPVAEPASEGGDESSLPPAGTDSSSSSLPSEKTIEPSESKDPSPVPTTAPRSSPRRTGAAGTARRATTSGPATDGESSESPVAD